MPITYENAELGTNESLKTFETPDALATSYLELKTKFDGGSMEVLPEEMRKDSTISKFKNVSELGKGYVEAQKMISGIKKAPENAEGYKFTAMSNLNPNLKTEGILTQFKGIFHKAGIANESADIVQQEVLSVLSNGMAQQEKAKADLAAKNETALRQVWGAEFDKKFDLVVNTLARAGGQEAMNETEAISKAMKGSPVLLKALGNVFSMLSEDSIGKLGEGTTEKQITEKTEAQGKIQSVMKEITADPKHPYHDSKNPKHDEFMTEWKRLHEVAFA